MIRRIHSLEYSLSPIKKSHLTRWLASFDPARVSTNQVPRRLLRLEADVQRNHLIRKWSPSLLDASMPWTLPSRGQSLSLKALLEEVIVLRKRRGGELIPESDGAWQVSVKWMNAGVLNSDSKNKM